MAAESLRLGGGGRMMVLPSTLKLSAAAGVIYISQSGSGTQDGLSCVNAKREFFNAQATGELEQSDRPGTTVFCGGTISEWSHSAREVEVWQSITVMEQVYYGYCAG